MISKYRSLLWLSVTLITLSAVGQSVTGSGSSGTVPVFTGSSTLGNSPITTTSSGNVGIGTTNPQGILDVNVGNGGFAYFRSPSYANISITSAASSGGGGQLFVGTGNQVYSIGTRADTVRGLINAFNIVDETNNATRFLINTRGNIGIGTTNPATTMGSDGTNFGLTQIAASGVSENYSILSLYNNSPAGTNNLVTLAFSAQNAAGNAAISPAGIGAVMNTSLTGSETGALVFYTRSALGPNIDDLSTERVRISPIGNVGIGTTAPGYKLDVAGQVHAAGGVVYPDGTLQSTAWTGSLCGGDYAESIDVSDDRTKYGPGDLLVIDPNNPGKFLKSTEAYSTSLLGVYSTKPGVLGRRQTTEKSLDEIPMAMVGIVPTKVSAENGAIKPGDLLVSSSTPGYAMKGTDRSRMLGAVLGKALGSLASGTGVIEVGVTLQ